MGEDDRGLRVECPAMLAQTKKNTFIYSEVSESNLYIRILLVIYQRRPYIFGNFSKYIKLNQLYFEYSREFF